MVAVLAIIAGSGIFLAVRADAVDTTSCNGVFTTYYLDADGDGFGNPGQPLEACSLPQGYSENNLDCNDANAAVNPDADEICDALDNNCDGTVNEGLATSTYYFDYDHDGYGIASTTQVWCTVPAGYATSSGDCDDSIADVNPGASEICDGLDNDCNGLVDDGLATSTYYLDADGDGYGTDASTTVGCAAPDGFADNADDCSDANAVIHPGAAELCDGIDNNCNGIVDEGCTSPTTYYRDADGDGYGNPNITVQAASQPSGYAANSNDCDDSRADVHPGANEICDGVDNNCNGVVDEGVLVTWYRDVDGDNYGTDATTTLACSAPNGYVGNNSDCNDNNAAINPGTTEICGDGIDNNCNGNADESCSLTTYYRDLDGDGYGNANVTKTASTAPDGYVSVDSDCNDNNANIHPGATEACDGIDNDCDGTVDEGCSGLATYYRDADGDGYGNPNDSIEASAKPACYVADNSDCSDNNASVHPGAAEICDGLDNDCDGTVDEGCSGTNTGNNSCNCNCQCACSCQTTCTSCSQTPCTACSGNCNNYNHDYDYDHNNDSNTTKNTASENNEYKNHGAWVSEMAHWTNDRKNQGLMSGQEKGRVMSGAAKQDNNNFSFKADTAVWNQDRDNSQDRDRNQDQDKDKNKDQSQNKNKDQDKNKSQGCNKK